MECRCMAPAGLCVAVAAALASGGRERCTSGEGGERAGASSASGTGYGQPPPYRLTTPKAPDVWPCRHLTRSWLVIQKDLGPMGLRCSRGPRRVPEEASDLRRRPPDVFVALATFIACTESRTRGKVINGERVPRRRGYDSSLFILTSLW